MRWSRAQRTGAVVAFLATVPLLSAAGPEIVPADVHEVLKSVRSSGAEATMVNVWATWCIPCREEFPDLMRLYREHRTAGFRLVLVSADFDDEAEAAREFLAGQGVDFPTYLKTGKDQEFIDTLTPEWTGALPATMIYDSEGVLRDFWQGRISHDEMEKRLLAVLEPARRPERDTED